MGPKVTKRQKPRTGRTFPPAADEEFESAIHVPGQSLPSSRSPEKYAAWFFDFLRTDLSSLTPGQRLGVRADLYAFVNPEIVVLERDDWHDGMPDIRVLEELQQDGNEGLARIRRG